MAEKKYAVIVTRVATSFTLDEAKAYSMTYRGRGYGTEIVTMDEAAKRNSQPQQDLTVLTEVAV